MPSPILLVLHAKLLLLLYAVARLLLPVIALLLLQAETLFCVITHIHSLLLYPRLGLTVQYRTIKFPRWSATIQTVSNPWSSATVILHPGPYLGLIVSATPLLFPQVGNNPTRALVVVMSVHLACVRSLSFSSSSHSLQTHFSSNVFVMF